MIRLFPAVERIVDTPEHCDWPSLPIAAPAHVRLIPGISVAELGSVIATLARFNAPDAATADRATLPLLAAVLDRGEPLSLPGGVMAVDDTCHSTIAPGCCAGLEEWRQWVDFLDSGEPPWLGHDPAPWLNQRDANIEICVMAGSPETLVQHSMTRAEYVAQLVQVEQHLHGFVNALRLWAAAVMPDHAARLVARVNEAFGPAPRLP